MSKHYNMDAERVVNGFKEILGEEVASTISEADFDQLSMLVESAISTSVLAAVEIISDQLDAFAHNVRSGAEHYDQ